MRCPNHTAIELFDRLGDGVLRCSHCGYNLPKGTRVLENMYTWLSVDENGIEGFMALNLGGVHQVLCHTKKDEALKWCSFVKAAIATMPGYKARLVNFRNREVVTQVENGN